MMMMIFMDVRGQTEDPVPEKQPVLPTEQEAGIWWHSSSEYRIEQKNYCTARPQPSCYNYAISARQDTTSEMKKLKKTA